MRGPALFTASLLGLLAVVSSAHNETSFCRSPPHWSVADEEPMGRSVGQVTVVALLQASCSFCLVQAASMGPLRDKLAGRGLTNISYMIVNDQSFLSKLMLPELRRRAPAGIPVYQPLPNQEDVWEILDGNKDDFLIYDRCGRLTFHIRLPLSYLHFPYVEAAIISTYYEDFCQNCSFYANVTQMNATIGNITTDVNPDRRSDSRTAGPGKDKHNGNKADEPHNDHRADNEQNHQPHQQKKGEPHQPIVTDRGPHQPIITDRGPHQPIVTDRGPHQPIITDRGPHQPIVTDRGPHQPVITDRGPHQPIVTDRGPHQPVITDRGPHQPVRSETDP
ncbi:selenoprotein Pb-like isoform X2 [Bufo gargarizans]|uniref:selenoprotein Pb-like isoform X2 n=1 Tax=Bufo gargarizans TaxID=30331 RepID=UPI001CF250DF|nr:selenoprotein Pb-like isoform X2 [Bufo gargarizans]